MLKLISLPHLGERYPVSSSRAASSSASRWPGRSPASRSVLLLDEPLSALDAKIRVSLREEIRAIQRELGITTIFVTHDQEEALSMSDRIVVMNEGRIEQVGTPFEIYNRPRTRFVASFVGTLNILNGKVVDPRSGRITIDDQEIRLPRHQRREGRRNPLGGAASRSGGDRAQRRGQQSAAGHDRGCQLPRRHRAHPRAPPGKRDPLDTFNNPSGRRPSAASR